MSDFEQKVEEAISQVKKDDSGKRVIPENLSEDVKFAVHAELRRRDTQAEYTKARQKIQALEVEKTKIVENWEKDYAKRVNTEISEEMQELKETDPDAYIEKKVENEVKTKETFRSINEQITNEASLSAELVRRQILLEEYNKEHPDQPLTDEVIQDNVPPKLVKQLENGTLDFGAFLKKAEKFIHSDKKIKTNEPEKNVDFNVSASSNTTNQDIENVINNDYKKFIF